MIRSMPEHEIEARKKRKKLDQVESNVPMELCMVLTSYTVFLMRSTCFKQRASAAGMTANDTSMQHTFSNLEHIRNKDFASFQIFNPFGWFTIPGTAFTSFLLGFLEIGQEIQNPFNYDPNDLDLDHFCLSIQRELHEISAYTNPEPSSFIPQRMESPLRVLR
ncbi:hypothetical protein DXG01_006691 [Tephrocybe rancida]|nr:hypothetical protein DXG01_006691 [Tephrocybe rancida]